VHITVVQKKRGGGRHGTLFAINNEAYDNFRKRFEQKNTENKDHFLEKSQDFTSSPSPYHISSKDGIAEGLERALLVGHGVVGQLDLDPEVFGE
jgi:hypothetical protein